MPTYIALGLGENLAETIDIGNWTTDGQKIRSLNGTSSLNLRFSADNEILLTNDDISFLLAYILLNTTALQTGFGTEFYIESTALASAFRVNAASAFVAIDTSAIQHLDISQNFPTSVFTFKLIENNTVFRESIAADNAALFLNTGSGANSSKILQNVRRAVCISGEGLTAKTDNTLYVNKISFQDIGTLFDNILSLNFIPTQDNTHYLQDKSGILAYLDDTLQGMYIEKWTVYNATLDATWQTITIADALPNSIIQITLENNVGGNRNMGVRQVGSILNRQITIISRSACTMSVKTDAIKQIQVYASVAADIIFTFSAQF